MCPIRAGEGCPKWGGGFFFFKTVAFQYSVERGGESAVQSSSEPEPSGCAGGCGQLLSSGVRPPTASTLDDKVL